jgi:hypothetical protein
MMSDMDAACGAIAFACCVKAKKNKTSSEPAPPFFFFFQNCRLFSFPS